VSFSAKADLKELMGIKLGCIVEGHGEIQALPILIRRLVASINPGLSVEAEMRRVPKSQLIRPGELERVLEAITRQIGRSSPVLVLFDADDDCPFIIARNLLERSRASHADLRVSIVVANREYEAWFIAAANSLAGKSGLPSELAAHEAPETIRDAKGWFTTRMGPGKRYIETRHQPAFTAAFSISEARSVPSFRKLEREVARLLMGKPD
jgi:hypothetical protein